MKTSKKYGLTLVEIVIVVALIALVSMIAIPNFMRNHQTANSQSFAQTIKQIAQKLELIFWGQNPNEYPPVSAFTNGLQTWAAPTNLGNIEDLERLLQKACEEILKQNFSAASLNDQTVFAQELFNCLDGHVIDYIVTEDLQNYWFNFADPYTTGYYSIGNGFSEPKYNDPVVPAPPPPPPPACGNGIADAGEFCGEPQFPGCHAGTTCINCQCEAIAGCGGFSGGSCNPNFPSTCPPGYSCHAQCRQCVFNNWNPTGGGSCFVGDTQILMTDGSTKAISDIQVGDQVASYNEETKTVVVSKVDKLLIHDPEIYWIINDRIKVTPNHSFYIDGKWKHIGQAELGDNMLKHDGNQEAIVKMELITIKEPIYNLEIQDTHTYYAEGVLVHNAIKGYTPGWTHGNMDGIEAPDGDGDGG